MKKPDSTPKHALPLLDEATVQVLTSHQSAEAPDSDLAARLRHKLMARIAQEATPRHLTVQASQDTWKQFLPGIERKVLHAGDGLMTYLLRLAPGAVLPAHRHPVDEECIVLSGVLRIGTELELPAGAFHLGRKNLPHAAITTDLGAVIYLHGAAPSAEMLI
jgi:quercetin dioxygenase-like cupin family protein